MTTQGKYTAAVIGIGRIGMLHESDPLRRKPATHFGMWNAHPRANLAAVCDNDPAKFEIARSLRPGVACYTDPERLLAEIKPDVVSIATWRDTHYEMMKLVMQAGVRVIVCEKPIAEKQEHATEIVREAEARGVELLINHRRRFDPLLYPFRDDLKNGLIGELMQVNCFHVFGLLTTGTHQVDALRFLLNPVSGDVAWVAGFPNVKDAHAPADDPCIDAVIGFESGLKVFMQTLNIRDYDHFDFHFHGRKGMAHFHSVGRDIDIYDVVDSPEHKGFTELNRTPRERRGGAPRDQFTFMADNAIACLDGTASSLSTGKDSLRALEILLAIQESAARDGCKIRV